MGVYIPFEQNLAYIKASQYLLGEETGVTGENHWH